MSTEDLEQVDTNREAMMLAAADASQAKREVLLWQKPMLRDNEVPDALGIPSSLWAALKAEGNTPKLFSIGRRLFVRTDDLREWVDRKAEAGRPGSKRLRAAAKAEEEAA